MLKRLHTLARGALTRAGEDVLDGNALLLLDQQIRDATAAVGRSRRALAVAIAHDRAEERRLAAAERCRAALEERAVLALRGGRTDLATRAAEAILDHEADCAAIRDARATFGQEIATLRQAVATAMQRLVSIERGRRLATTAEAVRQLTIPDAAGTRDTGALAEAEATLRRLRDRQAAATATHEALIEADRPGTIDDDLDAAGFGSPGRPTPAGVLERLMTRALAAPSPVDHTPQR